MKPIRKRLLIISLLLLAIGLVSVYLPHTSREQSMFVMSYGHSWNDDYFDASKWFENGMFQPRLDEDGNPHPILMLRTSPPPIPDSQLSAFRAMLAVALDPANYAFDLYVNLDFLKDEPVPPEYFKDLVMDDNFDPRTGFIYHSSSFRDKDKPIDHYSASLIIDGQLYHVMFDLDSITGKIGNAYRTYGIGLSEEEEKALLKKLPNLQGPNAKKNETSSANVPLLSEENHAQRPPKIWHAVRVEAKKPCPASGFWYTLAKENSRAFFEKGAVFPDFPHSKYGSTLWYWDENQNT
jgi:hypothetical protein